MDKSIQVVAPVGARLDHGGVKPDRFASVPSELRDRKQWVCWRYDALGKKPPFNPVTGSLASPTNPDDWHTFQTVVTASRFYDGIGFVLTKDDPLFGIDLDDKLDNPATPDEIKLFQVIFGNFGTYTEVSPSGRGLRIIGIGALPASIKGLRVGHVELYDAERYLTITGNTDFSPLPWVPKLEAVTTVGNCQPDLDYLLQLLQSLGASNSTINGPLLEVLETKSHQQIINQCWNQSNSEKFQALWNGQWQALQIGDGTQSAADMSLMEYLRFAGATLEQAIEIFKRSGLYRAPPAKAATYPMRTARAAFRTGQAETENWVALKAGFILPNSDS